MRGPLVVRRADLVLIDDPIKGFAEADGPTHREHVWNWWPDWEDEAALARKRAAVVAAQAEAGNLAVLAAPWNRAFLDELRDFPHGRKDDQVDALSRAFATLFSAPARAAPTPAGRPARRVFVDFMGR